MVPIWIWLVFIFAFGCCIGSFLNVVIYRLPREKSLITPPSACPACGKGIRFYDNIPLFSWLLLRARCRYCKAKISPRYFIVELFTGSIFTALFILFFIIGIRRFDIDYTTGLSAFVGGGWFIYLLYIILLAALIAASAIDLELWIIPISICWFVTATGIIGSTLAPLIVDISQLREQSLLPIASANTGALAVGAAIGMLISLLLLKIGIIKQSYLAYDSEDWPPQPELSEEVTNSQNEQQINHRLEAFREIIFLLPTIACALAVQWLTRKNPAIHSWWPDFSQTPVIAGFLGSLWGYFIGCGIVWATRIFGTLAFGKEAMGLGDVHLMGAAGTIVGPVMVVIAFFIAPFFGLAWATSQMFFKKIHQIPYGPFLSLGVFAVMILHKWIVVFLSTILNPL